MIEGITFRAVALFIVVALGQVGGSVLLAYTSGFTKPGWSLLCALMYVVSLYSLATLIKEGAPLSMMMPLLAALVPLCTIALAVAVLGESASWARIGLLSLSCGVIGLASLV